MGLDELPDSVLDRDNKALQKMIEKRNEDILSRSKNWKVEHLWEAVDREYIGDLPEGWEYSDYVSQINFLSGSIILRGEAKDSLILRTYWEPQGNSFCENYLWRQRIDNSDHTGGSIWGECFGELPEHFDSYSEKKLVDWHKDALDKHKKVLDKIEEDYLSPSGLVIGGDFLKKFS
ncbi:MAG: hypothetical protein WDZ77_01635 [Candidatus Pacearchaeota archaeon]